jgi:hypothetical protein
MTQQEKISSDGSWKILVDVFSINLFVYRALGVTTRVFSKSEPDWWQRLWGAQEAWIAIADDSVGCQGSLGSSRLPNITAIIPGSPNMRSNDIEADCRAWSVGVGITFTTDQPLSADPLNPNPSPGGGPSLVADRVSGSGFATRGNETLRSDVLLA